MSKEELEKEAVKYGVNNCGDCYGCHKKYRRNKNCERLKSVVKTYLASAEPREKRIEELEAEVTRLRNENLDIINKYTRFAETDRRTIAELEAQIEKMKCCENCKHSNTTCECYTICTIGHYDDCKSNTVLDSLDKKDYWEN